MFKLTAVEANVVLIVLYMTCLSGLSLNEGNSLEF